MKAVMYGAGNIGRGFIGPLFAKAGYQVTFIDVDKKIVDGLNEKGTYPVRLLSSEGFEEEWVKGVSAVNGADEDAALERIAEASIMATAVGVRVLPLIAPIIARGLKKRFLVNAAPLNIIVCENLIDADKFLAELVKKNLDSDSAELLEKRVGFVEASVGRMVPVQTAEAREGNSLRICSEKYAFLPVNKDAFIGEIPKIEGLCPFSDFDFFIQRKLFIHNMGHALCAYLGLILGDTYISDTIARPAVLFIVQNAMFESALALGKKFNVPLNDIIDHARDLLCRFNNRALKDTCARVGADVERKLGASDRFTGAIACCVEQGVTPVFIPIGAAVALFRLLKERSLEQTEENAEAVLEKTSALKKDSAESASVLGAYNKIKQGFDPGELLRSALYAGNKSVI